MKTRKLRNPLSQGQLIDASSAKMKSFTRGKNLFVRWSVKNTVKDVVLKVTKGKILNSAHHAQVMHLLNLPSHQI